MATMSASAGGLNKPSETPSVIAVTRSAPEECAASRNGASDSITPKKLGDWTTTAATSSLSAAPAPLFADGSTELSVQPDPRGAGWIEVQTVGFGAATLDLRSAEGLSGPWGSLAAIYSPPESRRSGVLVYAGKGHPELYGAQLVATYASNSSRFATLVSENSLYYPRFVRVNWSASNKSGAN